MWLSNCLLNCWLLYCWLSILSICLLLKLNWLWNYISLLILLCNNWLLYCLLILLCNNWLLDDFSLLILYNWLLDYFSLLILDSWLLDYFSLLCNNWLCILLWNICLSLISNRLIYYIKKYLLNHILFFNCIIFGSFSNSFNWNIFNLFFLDNLWNIFNIILDSIIICYLFCDWYLNLSSDFLIFSDSSFIWNIFNSWLSFNYLTLFCGLWNLWLSKLNLLSNLLLTNQCWLLYSCLWLYKILL